MDNVSQIVWAMIFGSIGFGFFLYGKKQKAVMPLLAGFALMLFPYFISNVYFLVIVGVTLVTLPYYFRF